MDSDQRCIDACCFVNRRVLSPPPKHGPIVLIMNVLAFAANVVEEGLENWSCNLRFVLG